MKEPLISISNADLGYARKPVLQSVNLAVEPGSFLGIVGPNGAGKTTLIRVLLGTLKPMSGEIRIARRPDGSPLRFGYVPQRDSVDQIYPLTILDMVMMARYPQVRLFRRLGKADREKAVAALAEVGIESLGGERYSNLSGGQKQRALIARALAAEPDLLILDEPTNGMDLAGDAAILDLVDHLHQYHSLAVVLVSHLLTTVANHAERIVLVREGYLEVGPVEQVLTGENLSSVYGVQVQVEHLQGQHVVVRGGAR